MLILLFIPGPQILHFLPQPHIAPVPTGGNITPPHRLQYGAALFLYMLAPHESALTQVRQKLWECLRQMCLQFQVQFFRVKGGKARRINDPGILLHRKHLHMSSGVPAPAQGLAHLSYL